jgi:phosphoribosylformylglycinamidine synthase
MAKSIRQLFLKIDETMEYCFNIESSTELSGEELDQLRLLLAEGFIKERVSAESFFPKERVVEMGPRLNFATGPAPEFRHCLVVEHGLYLSLHPPGKNYPY